MPQNAFKMQAVRSLSETTSLDLNILSNKNSKLRRENQSAQFSEVVKIAATDYLSTADDEQV